MTKLFLAARVPNEGARRLVWWLAGQPRGAVERLANDLDVAVMTVHRWVSGEIEPGADLSFKISARTGHAVVTSDWRMPARGGWAQRPAVRTYRVAA